MKHALIGSGGFVGSTLLKQTFFESTYRRTNIETIQNESFGFIVCAGAPAQKWLANASPAEDRKNIESLMHHLSTVTCNQFILISTVDVFKNPVGVDESSVVDEDGLHPYGLHRRHLEKFVEEKFPRHLIVRLPGLVGPGLRKNIIFDFLTNNNPGAIESRSIFQFYPMVNLWFDIQTALHANLSLVHLAAEPISVADVALLGFGKPFLQTLNNPPVRYDMQTKYAHLFGSRGRYQYSAKETIQAIRNYAQAEPLITKEHGRAAP